MLLNRLISYTADRAKVNPGALAAMTATVARASQQVASLILLILAAGVLSPAEYGVYTLAIIFVMLLQTLTYSGIYHYIVTAKGDEPRILDTAFWLLMAISGGGAIILLAISPLVSMLFNNSQVGEVVRWLAFPQPVAAAVAWASAVFMRQQRLQSFYNVMLIQNMLALIGGIILLLSWQSVFALVAFRYLRAILGALLFFSVLKRWPGFKASVKDGLTTMRYASGVYGSRLLKFLSLYAGDILLGTFMTTAEAGIYRFGVRLATASMDVVIQPVVQFALARFGAEARQDKPLAPSFERFWSTALVLVGCGSAAIIVFVQPAIELFFRPEYLPATVVAVAFATKAVFSTGLIFIEPFLAAKGRTGLSMGFHGVVAGAMVVGVLISAPFGMMVLSWTQAVLTLAATIAGFQLVTRMEPVDRLSAARHVVEGCLLVVAYGAALFFTQAMFSSAMGDRSALILSVLFGGGLGLAVLAIASRRKLFYLGVFNN